MTSLPSRTDDGLSQMDLGREREAENQCLIVPDEAPKAKVTVSDAMDWD